jgi:hypothetical protein
MPDSLSSMALASVELITLSLAVFIVTSAMLSAVRIPAGPEIMIISITRPATLMVSAVFKVLFSDME